MMEALIFDCDGVLVDTEKDGHRVAFNRAFELFALPVRWDVELYGELLAVSGGKERMRHYFQQEGWPEQAKDRDQFIRDLHRVKTTRYMEIIEGGRLPLRSGVKRLVDEAIRDGTTLAVCSTSNQRAVKAVVRELLGAERMNEFAAILAGDVVSNKKPDPEIYNLAKQRLGLGGSQCMVVEDSRNGLLAAKAAGMNCVITTSTYTVDEDFSEADAVYDALGDPPGECVTLEDLKALCTN
ncbi:MAG: HAD-IA family hydrolase [Candidatus Brocadiia bacterium]